ncbi:MAG: hypothetical protein JNK79_07385, partial [Chitinophagaceae bacterium]|nr:hypothetical protein [Chitinophagaceae bacterium]
KDKSVASLVKRLDDLLKVIKDEKNFDTKKITADIENGKLILNELSDRL